MSGLMDKAKSALGKSGGNEGSKEGASSGGNSQYEQYAHKGMPQFPVRAQANVCADRVFRNRPGHRSRGLWGQVRRQDRQGR